MRFYNAQHQYYCGGDLHARTLFLHILDAGGKTVFEKNLPASPQAFLDAVTPYREGLVVGVECMFAWYWLMSLTRSRFRADVPAKIFATHSSLPSCLAGPPERRGFWDALARVPASLERSRAAADPVEVFGTAAASTA